MARAPLSFLDYLSAAFNAAPIVRGLGAVPFNKLAVIGAGILGLANPGFWFVGAALEMGYLWMLSTDPRFQKWVQSMRMNVIQHDRAEKLGEMVNNLDETSVKRLNTLNANLHEIGKLMDLDADPSVSFMRDSKLQQLNQLSELFLRLLISRRVMSESLQRTDVGKLKREVKDIQRQLETPNLGEALQRSLRGNLQIQERRLENIKKAEENLQVVEMELQRIENQAQLIREEVAINRSPEGLSKSVDLITTTMEEAQAWMNNNADIFARIGEAGTPSSHSASHSAAASAAPTPTDPTVAPVAPAVSLEPQTIAPPPPEPVVESDSGGSEPPPPPTPEQQRQ